MPDQPQTSERQSDNGMPIGIPLAALIAIALKNFDVAGTALKTESRTN